MSIVDQIKAKRAQQAQAVPAVVEPEKPTSPTSKNGYESLEAIQELQKQIANSKLPIFVRLKLKDELKKALAEYEEYQKKLKEQATEQKKLAPILVESPKVPEEPKETFSLDIVLNEKQQSAADLALKGTSFVLTGAAGTGKTTAAREIAKSLLAQEGALGTHDFKIAPGERAVGPSIAFCAYTRRATNNIRRALHKDPRLEEILKYNVVTIHRLLEFEPVPFMLPDGKQSMRFEPQRHARNKLGITHLVIEESSMLDVNLTAKLMDALKDNVQIIYLGDINQLQPVMGKSVLNYALVKLPVIELDEVYRQALESDILRGAHLVLAGKATDFINLSKTSPKKQLKIVGSSKDFTEETLVQALAKSFEQLYKAGKYDPNEDIILSPFNKNACGTDNINNWIAQFLGKGREAVVHEVLAGRRKLYLAIGDKVMVDKRDGIISNIRFNGRYIGKMFQPADVNLTRFGIRVLGTSGDTKEEDIFVGYENLNIDEDPKEEKEREASHVVEVTYDDGGMDVLSAVGDFAQQSFSLGYALTVHKAQGCEWRKVYLVLHSNHAVMLHRELFYTACTRAKEELQIIANENTIKRAITNARIKGSSLAEKIEYFNSGALDASAVQVTT